MANFAIIRVHPRADREIDALADDIARDDFDAALRFQDAVQKTFDMIGEEPAICSLRYVHLPMEGLRVLSVSGFENHKAFYLERQSAIDVLRILHSARDIPAALLEE